MCSASGVAFASKLMKTKPPQISTFSSDRLKPPFSMCGKSQRHGTLFSSPSSDQVKPWNGQRRSFERPHEPAGFNWVPRCRQALGYALIAPLSVRTTSTERSTIS
ncbi:hypothetical protein D9M70_618110 [compost metagenome]